MLRLFDCFFSGSTVVGFVATLGPRLGMRTMVITRYSFGYWGTTLVSFVNILTQVRYQCSSRLRILTDSYMHNLRFFN